MLVNRYYGWYSDVGHTELIEMQIQHDLRGWHNAFDMPVIVTEYGADTIAGFHQVSRHDKCVNSGYNTLVFLRKTNVFEGYTGISLSVRPSVCPPLGEELLGLG